MPLPRFSRLPAESSAAILAVARAHFAREGKDAASFNQIIADAGISKTSAYHYFDGKDDLFSAVLADTTERAMTVLGDWTQADTESALWQQVTSGTERLMGFLHDFSDDRAVLASVQGQAEHDNPWIQDLVANGQRLGLIAAHPSLELITAATVAIFGVLDAWALSHPADEAAPLLVTLLKRLWNG